MVNNWTVNKHRISQLIVNNPMVYVHANQPTKVNSTQLQGQLVDQHEVNLLTEVWIHIYVNCE